MMKFCIHLSTLKIANNQNLKDAGMLSIHHSCKVNKNLRVVDFSGSRCFSNEALISLLADGGIVLQEVALTRCTQVNDLGLTGLCNPKNLKVLRVSKCSIHDESMSWIAEGCKKLEVLDVEGSHTLTDQGLMYLAQGGCHKLRTLNLKKCNSVTNAGLANFCPDAGRFLTNLDLTDCSQITDKGMLCLAEHCPKIATLNLFNVPNVTDYGLSRVAAKCIRLADLDFSADINSLDTTKKAKVPHIGGEGLRNVGKYSVFMRTLRCNGAARVDDAGISALSAGCPEIETVSLRYCYQISSVAVSALAKNCPNLTHLDVGSCVGVGDEAVVSLSRAAFKLKHIDFLGLRKITDVSFVPFARSHPNLESVNIQGCDMLSDDSITAVAETAALSLLHLDCNGIDELTDRSLKAVKSHCLNLRSADFTFCTVTDKGVNNLAASLPYSRKLGGRPALKPVNKAVVAYNQYTMLTRKLELAQTKLAVRIRVFLTKRYFQKQKAHKIYSLIQIQRTARGKLAKLKVLRIRARIQLEWDSTIPIQLFYRAYRKQLFAAALVAERRRKRSMATRIQAAWRVRMAKNAVKLVKFRLFKIGKKLRRLIKKALEKDSYLERLMASSKLLKWWRQMVENLKKYRKNAAASKIENCWRGRIARANKADKLSSLLKLWREASIKIQRRGRAMLVWKRQISRVRKEEEEFKKAYRSRVAAANTIRKEWRSCQDKGTARSFVAHQRLRKKCATMIQAAWRWYLARTATSRAKKYKAFLTACWGRMMTKVLFRYRTKHSSIIVRMVRNHQWWKQRVTSVALAQRVYRGYLGRVHFQEEWYAFHSVDASILIQYIFRKFLKRLAMEEEEWRNECAAVIQRKFRRFKEWQAFKKLMHKIYEEKAMAAIREKEALERQRQAQLLARIFERGEGAAAKKIQTRYRKYIHKKHQDEAAFIVNERKLRDVKEEERRLRMLSRKKHKNSVMGKLHDRLEGFGSKLNWLTTRKDPNAKEMDERDAEVKAKQALKPKRGGMARTILGPDKEEVLTKNEVFDNSILNRQTRSVESEGILGMKFTIGGGELFAMTEEQKDNKLTKRRPVWKRNNVDLSGRKNDKVYMWLLVGIGKQVYTSITLAQPPDNFDDMRVQKSRHTAMEMIGTFVIWHQYLKDLEVHCYAAVMAGSSAPPIDIIEVTTNEDQWEAMKEREFEQVTPDLQKQGGLAKDFHIWYHTKKFIVVPKLHTITTEVLGQYNWFDERMERTMETYGLRPDTVLELHKVYGHLDYKGNNVADVIEFFDFIGEPRSHYGNWILEACETGSRNTITFSEYANVIATFCMFGKQEILRFIFGMHDDERKSYLDREQWAGLIIILMEHEQVPHNKKHWNKEYDAYASSIGKKGSSEPEMFYADFVKITSTYPMICFSMFRLQEKMRKKHLGEKFWMEQRASFVAGRERLKVRKK